MVAVWATTQMVECMVAGCPLVGVMMWGLPVSGLMADEVAMA